MLPATVVLIMVHAVFGKKNTFLVNCNHIEALIPSGGQKGRLLILLNISPYSYLLSFSQVVLALFSKVCMYSIGITPNLCKKLTKYMNVIQIAIAKD